MRHNSTSVVGQNLLVFGEPVNKTGLENKKITAQVSSVKVIKD